MMERRRSPSSRCVATAAAAVALLALVPGAGALPNARETHKRAITTSAADVNGKTFDFVIAGGGLAGLAIAARLSEYANFTVAVIEAGPSGDAVQDQIDIPGYSYIHGLANDATYDWMYRTTSQTSGGGNVRSYPRGKVLGGSGAINGMFWCRGASVEYDAWNWLNPGAEQDWGGAEMMKYINKAENFTAPTAAQIAASNVVVDASVHGTSGPIQAGYSSYWYPGNNLWIPTWKALGFNAIDGAGGDNHGVTITPSTLNPTNQTRSDSKAGYIDPLPPRSNLVILTGYQVTSITFNSTTTGDAVASGVTFQATANGPSYSVKANKEVILSGGTIGSPQILQLSGIGPATTLTPLGIPVVVDLPVGHNLQDHMSNTMYWSTPTGTKAWGELRDNSTLAAEALRDYRNADFTNSEWTYVNEAIGYVNLQDIMSTYKTYTTTAQENLEANVDMTANALGYSDAQKLGLTAQYNITNNFLDSEVGQVEILLTEIGSANNVGLQSCLQRPYTRGTVLINSKSAFTAPTIDPRYYAHQYDVDITVAALNWLRTLARTAPMNTYMINEIQPTVGLTGAALATWARGAGTTEYHICGTASMMPRDQGGVVDTNLIVYGTRNVRVVDGSIIPLELSAHLMAPIYGIAEKAADIIKAKYQYKAPPSTSSSTRRTSTGAAAQGSGTASAVDANATAGLVGAAATSSKPLSNGAIGGIVGGGVALIALIAIVAAVVAARKKRRNAAAANEKSGWYAAGDESDGAWASHDNPSSVPLDHFGAGAGAAAAGGAAGAALGRPSAGFAGGGYNNRDSYNTLDLAAAEPMGHSNSYYGSQPYSDGAFTPPPSSGQGQGYPAQHGPGGYNPVAR